MELRKITEKPWPSGANQIIHVAATRWWLIWWPKSWKSGLMHGKWTVPCRDTIYLATIELSLSLRKSSGHASEAYRAIEAACQRRSSASRPSRRRRRLNYVPGIPDYHFSAFYIRMHPNNLFIRSKSSETLYFWFICLFSYTIIGRLTLSTHTSILQLGCIEAQEAPSKGRAAFGRSFSNHVLEGTVEKPETSLTSAQSSSSS
jgi:hypothetical protein